MKVIGHRGAAGLALENTLSSIELAKLIGVDAIEFDVRMTRDKKLVLLHDADFRRVSKTNATQKISEITLSQAKKITLRDGHSVVPTVEEALDLIKNTPVVFEIKSSGCAEQVVAVISKYKHMNFTIVSFKHAELTKIRDLTNGKVKLLALESTKPFETIQTAQILRLNGIGLNFWLLNPLTYYMINRAKLELYVYTVNSKFIGRLIRWLYPKASICSDHPEYFLNSSYPIHKSSNKH